MKKIPIVITLLFALACFWAAGARNISLARLRAEVQPGTIEALDNAPPLMAFTTVVLGGLRGLIADVLWLRLAYLQDEANYFEMVQLSDWITKLEPKCAEIWGYHAWNMAYNVSVMMPDAEDRWRWVRNGIHLLRDEGIVYNPGAPRLYSELGWLFQHKIGLATDTAHEYYKKEWAEEMTRLFGGPRPDYKRLEASPEARRRIEETYRMNMDTMREIEAKHGRLDWTRPEAHALYWATLGQKQGRGKKTPVCDRMIEQSVRALAGKPFKNVDSKEGDDKPNTGTNLLLR